MERIRKCIESAELKSDRAKKNDQTIAVPKRAVCFATLNCNFELFNCLWFGICCQGPKIPLHIHCYWVYLGGSLPQTNRRNSKKRRLAVWKKLRELGLNNGQKRLKERLGLFNEELPN